MQLESLVYVSATQVVIYGSKKKKNKQHLIFKVLPLKICIVKILTINLNWSELAVYLQVFFLNSSDLLWLITLDPHLKLRWNLCPWLWGIAIAMRVRASFTETFPSTQQIDTIWFSPDVSLQCDVVQ